MITRWGEYNSQVVRLDSIQVRSWYCCWGRGWGGPPHNIIGLPYEYSSLYSTRSMILTYLRTHWNIRYSFYIINSNRIKRPNCSHIRRFLHARIADFISSEVHAIIHTFCNQSKPFDLLHWSGHWARICNRYRVGSAPAPRHSANRCPTVRAQLENLKETAHCYFKNK